MKVDLFFKNGRWAHFIRHLHFSSTIAVQEMRQYSCTPRQTRQIIPFPQHVGERLSYPFIREHITLNDQKGAEELLNLLRLKPTERPANTDLKQRLFQLRLSPLHLVLYLAHGFFCSGTAVFLTHIKKSFTGSSKELYYRLGYGVSNKSWKDKMILRLTTERLVSAKKVVGKYEKNLETDWGDENIKGVGWLELDNS